MTGMAIRFRPFLLGALLLVVMRVAAADAQPFRVCAFGFNRPDELAALRANFPPADFDLLDFSSDVLAAQKARAAQVMPGAEGSLPDASRPWLLNLCRPDLRCDVTVYSGEFAGGFFGRYGSSIGVQELEEVACQPGCRGLFHQAEEVFLLACNTLATKDHDNRTPQEYLQVLLDHDFERAAAERVVEWRYGPLGPSFFESFRRIFAGVPRIYGFASVAPNGERTAALLRKYFESKRDYAGYLKSAAGDTRPNKELLAAFRGTSLQQTSGMTLAEPAAFDRALVCGVYDETRTVAQRLRILQELFARRDFLSFLPTIQVFLNRHPPQQLQDNERRIFAQIQRQAAARQQVIALVHDLNVSALQMELAHLALQLGWMTADGFRRLAVTGVRQLLAQPLTSEVVDILCAITQQQSLAGEFASEDVPERLFHEPEGLRLITCLSPVDVRVSTRLLAGLDSENVWARRWAAYALSTRLPLNDATLKALAGHLNDPVPDMRERVQWIFKAQRPLTDSVRATVQAYDPQLAKELPR